MASTIAAITTGIGGIVTTADATGNLSLLSGTSTVVAVTSAGAAVTGTMSVSGATTLTGGLNTPLAVTSGGTGVATSTGSGATVRGTSPTLTTPVINGFTGDTSVINIGSGQVYKDASGNVGIGTASPAGKLDITGANVLVKATASSGYAGFYANGATGSTAYNFFAINGTETARIFSDAGNFLAFATGSSATERMRIDSSGNVGIGTSSPSYKLHVNTDSAGKPGVGGLWTVVSDARIKSNIVNANLDRCYEIVKSVPLKHFGFAPGVYTDEQIQDKHNLGWIAQDVQKVFKNAVSVKPFTLKTDIPDGTEDYEEQDFTLEIVEKTETSIQVINGKPVQVSKVVTSENKVMLFDTVDVLDEAGDAVMDGDKPLTYQMPRMITKTRPKVRREVIEDCLDLNGGQMQAALYGAVQSLMEKIETLTTRITALEAK